MESRATRHFRLAAETAILSSTQTDVQEALMSRRIIQRLADLSTSLLLLFLLLAAVSSPARAAEDGIIRVKSAVPMAEAITRIKADIASKGIKFFSEIDQTQLAASAGIKL